MDRSVNEEAASTTPSSGLHFERTESKPMMLANRGIDNSKIAQSGFILLGLYDELTLPATFSSY